jgi:hypothetical protein
MGAPDVDREGAGVLVEEADCDVAIRAGQGSHVGEVADSGSAVTGGAVASYSGR